MELQVGDVYVNEMETLARCILLTGRSIGYADCGYRDMKLISPLLFCSAKSFKRWAKRQLPADEAARFPSQEAKDELVRRKTQEAKMLLSVLSDDDILAELNSRGGFVVVRTGDIDQSLN